MPATHPSRTMPSFHTRPRPQPGQQTPQARRPTTSMASRGPTLSCVRLRSLCRRIDVDVGQRREEPKEGDSQRGAEQGAAPRHQPQTVDRVGDGVLGVDSRRIRRPQPADHQACPQTENCHADKRDYRQQNGVKARRPSPAPPPPESCDRVCISNKRVAAVAQPRGGGDDHHHPHPAVSPC